MPITIALAHDFSCPWCWIAYNQVEVLKREFDVVFDWQGYELWPDNLEYPESGPADEPIPNKPITPSRLRLAYAASGMSAPTAKRPSSPRTHAVHEALEFAKSVGQGDALLDRLYRELYVKGTDVYSVEVLLPLCADVLGDSEGVRQAIDERRFAANITPFDDGAHSKGVYNVPTYFIGGERYAEQPLEVLREAIRKELALVTS